jgi:DNA replication protein DnaC
MNVWTEIGYNLPDTQEQRSTSCETHGIDVECLINGKCKQCAIDKQLQNESIELEKKINTKMIESNFIERYLDYKFEDYKTDNSPTQTLAVTTCKRYIANQQAIKNGKGLVIIGSAGVGKTMLATIIIKQLLINNKSIKTVQYLKYYQLNFQRYSQFNLYKLVNCDFLVIDEIGASNAQFRQDLLHEIVDLRYDKNKPIILISNLLLAEFTAIQSIPLQSRLRETTHIIEINSKDYRNFEKQ